MRSVSKRSVSNISFWFCHSPNSCHCGCRPGGRAAAVGLRRREGAEGLWGIGRKIERKLAARAAFGHPCRPTAFFLALQPFWSRRVTIEHTWVSSSTVSYAPIIEVYPPWRVSGRSGTSRILFGCVPLRPAPECRQSILGWKTNELLTGLFFTLSPSLLPSSLPSLFRERRRNESRLMSYEPTFRGLPFMTSAKFLRILDPPPPSSAFY